MQSVVSAIIVAAGSGVRMNAGRPKQYLTIAGRPVLNHTLQKFLDCRQVDVIYLVVPKADFGYCRENILPPVDPGKPIRLIGGGAARQHSVYKGLAAVEEKNGLVIIHDGVRPLVQTSLISDCILQAQETGACIAGIPVYDTIKRAGDSGDIEETVERKGLWLAQTPQVFRYGLIRKAHDRAIVEGYTGTDDAILVERIGNPVKIITGSKTNIKITTREDLAMAASLLQQDGSTAQR